jgi:hypothetical protein
MHLRRVSYDKNKKELTIAILCPTNQIAEISWRNAQARAQELAGKWISACEVKPQQFSHDIKTQSTDFKFIT